MSGDLKNGASELQEARKIKPNDADILFRLLPNLALLQLHQKSLRLGTTTGERFRTSIRATTVLLRAAFHVKVPV